jgi:thermolysin
MNYLEDLSRSIGTFDYGHGAFGGYPTFRVTDSDNIWTSGGEQTAAIDAHWGATQVIDYYRTTFGRNGIDGSGGPLINTSITSKRTKLITSGVHYSTSYVNAGWTGSSMLYGDGDGVTAGPLTSLDVVGHEFTHGVTQHEAGLIYTGESGALNEAISDIFGSMIEARTKGLSANTWKIGEECWTPAIAGDALRYMDEPHRASEKGYTADDDPDHYTERYMGSLDNGGVHVNSGIVNKQFYLLAMGGTHHLGGSMTGIGTTAASAIWYHALADYMTSSTDFAGARVATINASNALYGAGSTQSAAVAQAWSLVGVF